MPITGFLYNRSNFFIVFILFIIFLLTSETFNYYESITNGYSDIKTYYDISSNGFDENLGHKNTQHRLERWPIHISIHYISKITKIGIWDLYRSFILLIMLSAFFIINTLRTTSPLIKICLWSYLTFNPFSFRLYYLAPGMIADSLLFLSFTIFVCGVINKNNFQMILSIIISNLSKQTALLLVPFLLILYYNKMISKRNLLSYVILVFLIFTFVKLSTISFFGAQNNNYFTHHLIGLFLWLKNDFSINQFIYFFGRYVFFLMTLSPLLIIGKFKVSSIFLLFFILISLQPILGGPPVTGGSIQRLSAIGIPFFIPFFLNADINLKRFSIFIVTVLFSSFHHQSTVLSGLFSGKIIFLIIIITVFLFSISIFVYDKKKR